MTLKKGAASWEVPEWEDSNDSWTLVGAATTSSAKTSKKRKRKESATTKSEPPAKKAKTEATPPPKSPVSSIPDAPATPSKKKRKRKSKQAVTEQKEADQTETVSNNNQKRDKDASNSDDDGEDNIPVRLRAPQKVDPLREKLKGGQFRWLNEQLYTTDSAASEKLFSEDSSLFYSYHEGFRNQVREWPENPVEIFISYLKKHPDEVAGDFGCGDAQIAASVTNKVHSFDLVAVNEKVTACDIAHVPLKNKSLDVAIYSLSLMGTNVADFLMEAHRVLKPNGKLKIAEVKSRFASVNEFVNKLKSLGFDLVSKDDSNKMFILFDFKKHPTRAPSKNVTVTLKACTYKKR